MGTAMFPLGAVLFPHTPLALRIFEERYLVMLGRLLDETDPAFGVVLIERGSETGGGDQRFALGTMAQLSHVVPQAGQMQIVARGTERFEIVEWLDDAPYPRADVRALPDLEWNDALMPLLEEAERIVRRVLGRAQQYGGTRWDPRSSCRRSRSPAPGRSPRSRRWVNSTRWSSCAPRPWAGCSGRPSTSPSRPSRC